MTFLASMFRSPWLARGLFLTTLFIGLCGNAQLQCPTLTNPLNGDGDVPVNTEVSWNIVGGINGYSVSLGTSAGASDILNSRSAALVNFLVPLVGLPDNTEIFVTISLFLDDGTFITCPTESFTTVDVTIPPNCTSLITPFDNAQNVGLGENLTWNYAPTATGYKLAMGTSQNGSEILSEIDVGNVVTYRLPENLPASSEVYVRITPYNENGEALSCTEENFMTGDSSLDCELFLPEIDVPTTIGWCEDDTEIIISTEVVAEGFRWYRINGTSNEVLISEIKTVTISDIGEYRMEAYNNVSLFGDKVECISSKYFSVVYSHSAIVESIKVFRDQSAINLEIFVSGLGDYEYALDDLDGPYQDSAVFSSLSEGDHNVYVRDKNGCGITEYRFIQTITKDDFPNFFTPNYDGINDFWQVSPIHENIANLGSIQIFDRFGNFISQQSPESIGWDGNFNGKPLPSSTYWFKATSIAGKTIMGYFALKR